MSRSILALKSSRLALAISLVGALLLTPSVFAASAKDVQLTVTGYIASQTLCSATVVCQESIISGVGTHLGRFEAVLVEEVNILDGSFTGATTITTSSGDTLNTTSTGQLALGDVNGLTFYVEQHTIISGTGRFAGASGQFEVTGTADPVTLELVATGVGEILLKGD